LSLTPTSATKKEISDVPAAAAWLGGLGVLPFFCLSFAERFANGPLRTTLAHALLTYGAVILSFLGGIHWGLAISERFNADAPLLRRLGLSVIPSLIAWTSLLAPVEIGWLLVAVAFVAMLLLDVWISHAGEAPLWYPRLRWPLTCAAVMTLLLGRLG
jgi:Protein of unknown function (DUF3429)